MEASRLLLDRIQTLIDAKKFGQLSRLVSSRHPADLVETVSSLTAEQIWEVLCVFTGELRAQVFSHMDSDLKMKVALSLPRGQLADLLPACLPMTGWICTRVFPKSRPNRSFRLWPRRNGRTSGSLLRIRKVGQIMDREVIFATVLEDQEEATQKISKYSLLALPVVNEKGLLVGIITYDDAMDVLSKEHTEDMEKFMAITGKHEEYSYLRASVWTHFSNRVLWIIILAALGLISGMVIRTFESTLRNLLILAAYMPMVIDTGGNTGSQAATVVIRALALRQVSAKDTLRILWKELGTSILLSAVVAILIFGRVALLSGETELKLGQTLLNVGFAISLALTLQLISATLVGALLPMAASWFKLDPAAVVASPALTTVVDITGLLIYFSTVKLVLRI